MIGGLRSLFIPVKIIFIFFMFQGFFHRRFPHHEEDIWVWNTRSFTTQIQERITF